MMFRCSLPIRRFALECYTLNCVLPSFDFTSRVTLPFTSLLCDHEKKKKNELLFKREFSVNEGVGCGNLFNFNKKVF